MEELFDECARGYVSEGTIKTLVVGLPYMPFVDRHKSGRTTMGGYSISEMKNIGAALSSKACLFRCSFELL